MASLLGIDGLAEKVQTIIMGLRTRIDQAIDGMIDKAKEWFKGNGKNRRNPEEEEAEGEQQNDPANVPDNRTPEPRQSRAPRSEQEKNLFLCADACWLSPSFKKNRMPSITTWLLTSDWKAFKESLYKLHLYYKKHPEVRIVPTHCMEAVKEAMAVYS